MSKRTQNQDVAWFSLADREMAKEVHAWSDRRLCHTHGVNACLIGLDRNRLKRNKANWQELKRLFTILEAELDARKVTYEKVQW